MMEDTNQICWQITNQLGYFDGSHGVLIAGMMEQHDMVKNLTGKEMQPPFRGPAAVVYPFPKF